MKTYRFDMKYRIELFIEHVREKFPKYKDAHKKLRFATPQEKEAMFLEIMNKYGEKGWIINPHAVRGESGKFIHYMQKEVYSSKKSEEKESSEE